MANPRNDASVRISGEDEGATQLLKALQKALRDTDREQRNAATSGAQLHTGYARLSSSVSTLTTYLHRVALGYAAVQAARFVKGTLDQADAVGKLAQKTGIAAETLSVFLQAASTADVAPEQLEKGLRGLGRTLTELRQGSRGAVDAFAAIGLSARDLEGLGTDQVFLRIADAQAQYEDGAGKATVAGQLFGDRVGSQLIPLLNDLAGDGFKNAEAAARRMGLVFDRDATESAQKFNDTLTLLGRSARGVVSEFAQGIAPALGNVAEALLDTGEQADETMARTLGEKLGDVLREGLVQVYAFFRTFGDEWDKLRVRGVGTLEALQLAAAGHFIAAAQRAKQIGVEVDAIAQHEKSTEADVAAFRAKLFKAPTAADPAVAAAERRAARLKQLRIGEARDAADVERARLEAARRAVDGENRIADARARNDENALRDQFERGLASLGAYLDARVRLVNEAAQREAQAFAAERAAIEARQPTTAAERVQQRSDLTDLTQREQAAGIQTAGALLAIEQERARETVRLDQTIAEAERHTQELRGQTASVTRALIEDETQAYATALRQRGRFTEQAVAQFRESRLLSLGADEAQRAAEGVFAALGTEREAIDQRVRAGTLSAAAAERELAALERARVPELARAADEMLRYARALGSPELIQQAEALKVRVAGLGQVTRESAQAAAEFGDNLLGAVQGDLANVLGSIGGELRSLGDVFAALATSIVQSAQQILGNLLASEAVDQLRDLLHGGGGAATTGVAQAAAAAAALGVAGTAVTSGAKDTGAAAVALGVAGTAVTSGASAAQTAAGALLVAGGVLEHAAVSLAAAAAALAGQQLASGVVQVTAQAYAGGGIVHGPGTGTSDSVLAWLSNMESVITAAQTEANPRTIDALLNGENVDAMLAGVKMPRLRALAPRVPRFAQGGIVSTSALGGGAAGVLEATLGLEDGLVLKHLASRDGEAVQLDTIRRNARQIRAILK